MFNKNKIIPLLVTNKCILIKKKITPQQIPRKGRMYPDWMFEDVITISRKIYTQNLIKELP